MIFLSFLILGPALMATIGLVVISFLSVSGTAFIFSQEAWSSIMTVILFFAFIFYFLLLLEIPLCKVMKFKYGRSLPASYILSILLCTLAICLPSGKSVSNMKARDFIFLPFKFVVQTSENIFSQEHDLELQRAKAKRAHAP